SVPFRRTRRGGSRPPGPARRRTGPRRLPVPGGTGRARRCGTPRFPGPRPQAARSRATGHRTTRRRRRSGPTAGSPPPPIGRPSAGQRRPLLVEVVVAGPAPPADPAELLRRPDRAAVAQRDGLRLAAGEGTGDDVVGVQVAQRRPLSPGRAEAVVGALLERLDP